MIHIQEIEKKKADLSGANLYRANLYRANLYRANLSGANLSEADLFRANLSGANLYRANLYRADLSGVNLSEADLSGADLSEANLSRASLSEANLFGAIIAKDTVLEGPYLSIGPIGARKDYLRVFKTNKEMYLRTGCWGGTEEQFRARLDEVYPEGKYREEYLGALEYSKKMLYP